MVRRRVEHLEVGMALARRSEDGREAGVWQTATLRRLTDEPVAEIVQCGEPAPKLRIFNDLWNKPLRSIELPQVKSLN
jgi:hypothetical protein